MNLDALKSDLAGVALEDNPRIVQQKSRDFYWYSPVLKRQLENVTADLVAAPTSEDELLFILGACFRNNVPVTVRGSGTGNYGQAMPLAGGLVLDLARMNKVKHIGQGYVVAEPGAILADIDNETRASGQELRLSPSTYHTASIGGFVAGGSGGVGSIRWGGLRDTGNIIRLRIAAMDGSAPSVIDLSGADLAKASHAYGTTGVITEVEMPLAPAYDWVDMLVSFPTLRGAATCAEQLAGADGLLLKNLSVVDMWVTPYFRRHAPYVRDGEALMMVMAAPFAASDVAHMARRAGGTLTMRSDQLAEDVRRTLPAAFELGWNHTTLRALRVDPAITYLQSLYPQPSIADKVIKLAERFGEEMPTHLEFVRFDGAVGCFGLPLVRYTTEERLEEIIRIHEDEGCPIFNPHRYTLEEGGMKQTDEVQLAFKRRADPKGLLNPGKMVAWDNPSYDYGKPYLFPTLSA
ncbi:FAD-binding oxidoreductase [Acuticoccus sp. MNP-M23]|uniref:FAD-binding oxidoreductase n=1 Tax=Acuticoccus sp. MNP-M23 TaxID=3072793 RepID=UPI00281653F9|nr:FAD-binding oxidoreductase [Acuticoccus sp. MNP-M23]WMS43297.1 FAD-binding oxidoreductase [Acuticoccus sp. MNP-M23]